MRVVGGVPERRAQALDGQSDECGERRWAGLRALAPEGRAASAPAFAPTSLAPENGGGVAGGGAPCGQDAGDEGRGQEEVGGRGGEARRQAERGGAKALAQHEAHELAAIATWTRSSTVAS